MRYVIGLIFTALGVMMVIKTEWVVDFSGRVDFAEKYLGTEGGTRIFWKLVGVIIVIVSWMYMFNLGESILRWLFLPASQR
jgi:hypothetical protein